MADIDLATILADGEYLKREGDTLVGEIPAAGGSPEDAVDAVAAALVEGAGIDIVYDDTANTITLASTAAGGSTILDGSGPPDVALGAVGNYYEDITNGVLYGPKTASGWGTAQQPAIASTPNNFMSGENGGRWRFVRAGRLVGLRYRRLVGCPTAFQLRVWADGTTTKLADFTNTQADVAGPFDATLPTPIIVSGNDVLRISYGFSTSASPYRTGFQTVTNTADVAFLGFVTGTFNTYPSGDAASTSYVEPIFEPNEAWPVTVRTVNGYQTTNSALTDLATKWTPASSAGPSSLKFAEDTDGGVNTLTLIPGPTSWGSDFLITVPASNGTMSLNGNAATLSNKTIDGASNTLTNIPGTAVSTFTTTEKGVVPAPATSTGKFLKDDGTWGTPAGGGGGGLAVKQPIVSLNYIVASSGVPGLAFLTTGAATASTANQFWYTPMVVDGAALTITSCEMRVSTAGTAGTTARIAIYEAGTGWMPGNRVADLGTLSIAAAGRVVMTGLSVALPVGLYLVRVHTESAASLEGHVLSTPWWSNSYTTQNNPPIALHGSRAYGVAETPGTAPTAHAFGANGVLSFATFVWS